MSLTSSLTLAAPTGATFLLFPGEGSEFNSDANALSMLFGAPLLYISIRRRRSNLVSSGNDLKSECPRKSGPSPDASHIKKCQRLSSLRAPFVIAKRASSSYLKKLRQEGRFGLTRRGLSDHHL